MLREEHVRLLLAGEDRFGQGPFVTIDGWTFEAVGFAATPDEALELAVSTRPDVVLLDHGMSSIACDLSDQATVVIVSPSSGAAAGAAELSAAPAAGATSLLKIVLALATTLPQARLHPQALGGA